MMTCSQTYTSYYELYVSYLPPRHVTNERSFRSLRRLKTHLRSTVSEDRLNGLAVLSVHRNEISTPDGIVEELFEQNIQNMFMFSFLMLKAEIFYKL